MQCVRAVRWLARRGLAQQQCMFDAAFCRGHEAARWQATAVVVGMHPDEATEPVVVEALAAGKPFAVVPCCVFPTLFPHRRTTAGKLVTTHAEFVAYLCALHPGIQTDEIEGLPGCNTVVYWMAGEGGALPNLSTGAYVSAGDKT